jgi:hypothetical protein
MLTTKLPGSGVTGPYRGLSCVLGNSLAQFSGGDGAARLPTYPVFNNENNL